MTLNVGYAENVITPSLGQPVFLAGFSKNRRAETIHDDLFVRALALKDEKTILVLAALDLIGFFRPYALEIAHHVQKKAPGVQVIVASIHNHHAPDTMGLWGPDQKTSGVDPAYLAKLKDKIVVTILASLAKMQPSTLKATSVNVPGVAKNARDPEIVDDELTLAAGCCRLASRTRSPVPAPTSNRNAPGFNPARRMTSLRQRTSCPPVIRRFIRS